MCDSNIFAVLTPFDPRGLARDAFRLTYNVQSYRNAIGGVAHAPVFTSRESTPAPEAFPVIDRPDPGFSDRILLTFDHKIKDGGRG